MNGNSELLQNVITQSRLTEKSCFSEKVYRDEPILMTASQMANYTPPIYKKMREIAHANPLAKESYIFYKQALFMEHHTDCFAHEVSFLRYYPTYHMMSDAQLRAYFTWRTQVRQGNVQKTNLAFAYIYMYELLNGIGAENAEDGFMKLLAFRNSYIELDAHIGVYLNRWLKDYCIYYNLSSPFLGMIPDFIRQDCVAVLLQSENYSCETVFDALLQLSDYNFPASRFFKLHEHDCKAVAAEVVNNLNLHYRNSGLYAQREFFFGTFNEGKRDLFAGAVFYEHPHEEGYTYAVSGSEEYEYRCRQWYFRKFMCFSGKTQRTGALLRTLDSKMREAFGFKNALKKGNIPEHWENIIDLCIDNLLIKKRFESAPRIEIDLTCLQGIRADALETQQRLLIVQEEEPVVLPAQSQADDIMQALPAAKNETKLTDLQFEFLHCLLHKLNYNDLLHRHNTTAGIVCDEINEILFDDFCDTVIDFDGESPNILEDYIDDVKGYIGL